MENFEFADSSAVLETNNPGLPLSEAELKQFEEQGYLGPYTLFEPEEAKTVANRCFDFPKALLPHVKGRHAMVKEMAQTAMNPMIVKKIASILGEDVLLWGSIIIKQKAAGKHPMHVDLEHTAWDGVSIWLAMENVTSESFSIVSGSHLFNISPQELNKGKNLDFTDDEVILQAAKKINPNSKVVHLNVKDGQFIIFSGKLWHGTKNKTAQTRTSLVFQYTRPENKVKIPKAFTTPLNLWYKKSPPCLLVNGKDKYKINKLINPRNINKISSYFKGVFYYLPTNLANNLKDSMNR